MVAVAAIPVPCTPQSIAVNSTSGSVYVGIPASGCSSAGQDLGDQRHLQVCAWNVTVSASVAHLAMDPVNGTLLFSGVHQAYSGVSCLEDRDQWLPPGKGTANSSANFVTAQSLAWLTFSANGTRVFATDQANHIAVFQTSGFSEIGNVSFTNGGNDEAVVLNPVTGDIDASGLSAQQIEVVNPSDLHGPRNLSFPAASYYYYIGNQAILGIDSPLRGISSPPTVRSAP